MTDWTRIIPAEQVPEDRAIRVRVESSAYVVARVGDAFFVADAVCPHQGGPLGGAEVIAGRIICPVHYWAFDLRTGCTDRSGAQCRLRVYPTLVREGSVFADLSSSQRPPQPPDLDVFEHPIP